MNDTSETLVFDSSVLSCFARAGRLEVLRQIVASRVCVVTADVLVELDAGRLGYPKLAEVTTQDWLAVVTLSEVEEVSLFAVYSRIFGAGPRDLGEAATLAWAEAHKAVAIVDDETAVNAGRGRGVVVRRTLALVADAIRRGLLDERAAVELIDELIAGGARFPRSGAGFITWARDRGIL